jgi:dihydropyrimidine dehydrogenase (NADP+)
LRAVSSPVSARSSLSSATFGFVNVTPRYAKLLATSGEVIGWENIELISDRPFKIWEDEFKKCKDVPDRRAHRLHHGGIPQGRWIEIVERCQAAAWTRSS